MKDITKVMLKHFVFHIIMSKMRVCIWYASLGICKVLQFKKYTVTESSLVEQINVVFVQVSQALTQKEAGL